MQKGRISSEYFRPKQICYYYNSLSSVYVRSSLVLCVCFVDRCLSLCTFFLWPLCYLFLLDLRILISPMVSSRSSYDIYRDMIRRCAFSLKQNLRRHSRILSPWPMADNVCSRNGDLSGYYSESLVVYRLVEKIS